METSILISTKKTLGLAAEYEAFDLDIITHINSAFSTLTSLGVGPVDGFMIDDETANWEDFLLDDSAQLNSVKTYVSLKSRMLFDPPATSFHIAAMEKQIEELAWRLNSRREETEWVDPDPPVPVEEVPL